MREPKPVTLPSYRGASDDAVEAEGLSLSYGGRPILHAVSLRARPGRISAILGPNGAGKSTLFRALLGLESVSSGSARLLGRDSRELGPRELSRIAFVPETHVEEPRARIRELVELRSALYPQFDRDMFAELAATFGLRREARIRELSRGQRAGVVVSLALAQDPELLLLDDPTLGLDPVARRLVIDALLGYARDKAGALVFASHDLGDVERIADDVVVLSEGSVRAAGQLSDIVDRACAVTVAATTSRVRLTAIAGVLRVEPRRDALHVVVYGERETRRDALARIERESGGLLGEPAPLSFEDCALSLLRPSSHLESLS
ncbi:MAG: ABC transporter ATP-binding protein [Polyangiaceae bacterium]